MKLFDRWETENIKVKDLGLEKYINLEPVIMPRTGGIHASKQFHKSKVNIVERLMNKLMVPGHRGRKHVMTSGRCVGQKYKEYKTIKSCFERIEKETNANPVEVFVKAIENSALREEITSYQVGGMMVRRAVITSPQRRVNLALTTIVQAAYKKCFGKKQTIVDALTAEIIGAYSNDASKSEAVKERERVEREAEGAR